MSQSNNRLITVTTDEFWNKMCEIKFVRLSLRFGAIGNDIFFVSNPPEHADKFEENIISKIAKLLRIEEISAGENEPNH
jgi:hypothetical protein